MKCKEIAIVVLLLALSLTSESLLTLQMKEVEICTTCRKMISAIKQNNNIESCRMFKESSDSCNEIYYYLLYFQPEYLNEKKSNEKDLIATNCEICSNIDQCSYKQCTEDYYNNIEKKKGDFLGVGSKKGATELEFQKLAGGARFANSKAELSKNKAKVFSSDKDYELFFTSHTDTPSEVDNSFAYNFQSDAPKTKLEILIYRLENRLKNLQENIRLFLKINIQTSIFKRNVINFFLYLKIKQQDRKDSIDRKIFKEKGMLDRLKSSALEIMSIQNKLIKLKEELSRVKMMHESLQRNQSLRKTMLKLAEIIKETNTLFKTIQQDNLNTINVFRKKMFNNEMHKLWVESQKKFGGGKILAINVPNMNEHLIVEVEKNKLKHAEIKRPDFQLKIEKMHSIKPLNVTSNTKTPVKNATVIKKVETNSNRTKEKVPPRVVNNTKAVLPQYHKIKNFIDLEEELPKLQRLHERAVKPIFTEYQSKSNSPREDVPLKLTNKQTSNLNSKQLLSSISSGLRTQPNQADNRRNISPPLRKSFTQTNSTNTKTNIQDLKPTPSEMKMKVNTLFNKPIMSIKPGSMTPIDKNKSSFNLLSKSMIVSKDTVVPNRNSLLATSSTSNRIPAEALNDKTIKRVNPPGDLTNTKGNLPENKENRGVVTLNSSSGDGTLKSPNVKIVKLELKSSNTNKAISKDMSSAEKNTKTANVLTSVATKAEAKTGAVLASQKTETEEESEFELPIPIRHTNTKHNISNFELPLPVTNTNKENSITPTPTNTNVYSSNKSSRMSDIYTTYSKRLNLVSSRRTKSKSRDKKSKKVHSKPVKKETAIDKKYKHSRSHPLRRNRKLLF